MKKETEEGHYKAINCAIDYINAHLVEVIELKTLAEVCNISKYHFHRIFKACVGESLQAYMARLRLENAAQKLQVTNLSLNEIAEMTGYKTQYSLSKAFKRHFGISPSVFRSKEVYDEVDSQSLSEYASLSPQVRTREECSLVYIRVTARYGLAAEYDKAWAKLLQFGEQHGLLGPKTEYIGLSFDDPYITQDDKCRFYACITTEKPLKPEGAFGMQSLAGGKYAIFTLKGPYCRLIELYRYIYLNWLPESKCRLRKGMPFEKYLNSPDEVVQEELLTEIFIPIA